jgi:putative endonuclease
MPARRPPADWSVYILRTARDTLYTGIALDVAQRLRTHERGKGSRALRGRGPLRLIWWRVLGTRSLALRVEHRIKQLTRLGKERLLARRPSRERLLHWLGLPPSSRRARRRSPTAAPG